MDTPTLREVAELAEFSVGCVWLLAAYQALDPAAVSDEDDPGERFPLEQIHVVVERAFSG